MYSIYFCVCMTVNCNSFLTYHDTSLQTDAHQHFEVNRRLNNKTPNPPGTSGSGGPAPPSNSASIQESNVALQKIIASSFKNTFCSVLHEKPQGYEGNANLALTNAFESAAVGLSKQFHGDSVHTPFLEQQRALIGCPTTLVTLQSGNQPSLTPALSTQAGRSTVQRTTLLPMQVTSKGNSPHSLGVAAFVLIPMPLRMSQQPQVLPSPIPFVLQRPICPKPAI